MQKSYEFNTLIPKLTSKYCFKYFLASALIYGLVSL
jgi:hypothetical protein